MTIHVDVPGRNAQLDAVLALANGGSVQIRSDVQPATAADAATGTLLATLTLNNPAFDPAANGSAALNVDTPISSTGAAAGTATWARVLNSSGGTVMDGSLGTTGNEDFTVNSTAIAVGQPIDLTGGTVSAPA